MARDLRNLFEKEREQNNFSMKDGHEDRFFAKLEKEMPNDLPKGKMFSLWMQIAASVVVAVGLSFYYFNSNENTTSPNGKVTVVDNDNPNGDVQGIYIPCSVRPTFPCNCPQDPYLQGRRPIRPTED